MRKIIFIFCLQLFPLFIFCQEESSTYIEVKALIKNRGYSIKSNSERYANLSQGQEAGDNWTFYAGTSYIIVTLSDDDDVTDMDLYLKNTDGSVYTKDTDTDAIAVIQFSPGFTRDMKVVMKNYSSRTPNYKSRCRYIIGYK